MLEIFLAAWFGFTVFLAHRVFIYRAAIIQLQADMTLVLNELTRPQLKQSIECNLCNTRMTPNEYAHHFCERITTRAQAMTSAQKAHVYDAR